MTHARPMPSSFLIAALPDPATWQGVALGLLGATSFGTIFAAIYARYGKRADDSKAEIKARVKEDANVEVERVKADASERERVFQAWQANEQKYAAEARAIREEMRQMRRTFGHEIRGLQNFIFRIQDFYHLLHNAATMLDMQNRILRVELKELLGDKFDERKFPLIDLSLFDPKALPRFEPTNGWDEPPPSNDKKITGRITLTPDTPP